VLAGQTKKGPAKLQIGQMMAWEK